MKIVLTTTTLVALLAIGLLGLNNSITSNNIGNAFAQMDQDAEMMGNDTGGMMGMDDEGMSMTMSSNQSKGEGMEMKSLNGTVNVESTIAEAFKSKVTTDIIGAIQAAQANVGANSMVKEAELTHAHGYLVYKITAVDENMKKYKVIVDPGNGQVLMKKEVTGYEHDEYEKMKYSHGDEKYGKYSGGSDHGYDDYDQKNTRMEDKKY
jgi:uncharacterized membrane protein YkoI